MKRIVMIAGSPSAASRSSALLQLAADRLGSDAYAFDNIIVRDLNAQDLIHGQWDALSIRPCIEQVKMASGIIIATPVYKAAYAGVLKSFLDILPPDIFASKVVMPVMTGASGTHSLALDYALKPVLLAMGANYLTRGIYLHDKQLQQSEDGLQFVDENAGAAWQLALGEFEALIQKII